MSILERTPHHPSDDDLTDHDAERPDDLADDSPDEHADHDELVDPPMSPDDIVPVHGMRIRRVRLRSVAKLAAVFFTLGYAAVIGTMILLWNVAERIGFIADFEELIMTSLGLETFELAGRDIFDVVLVGAAMLAVLGFVVTILMAIVYNAACTVFGGLAVETGPLRRRRRYFSLRHRGWISA